MKNCFLFLCLTISFFSFTLNGETFNKKNAFENVLKEIDDTLNNFKDIKDIVGEEFTQKEAKEPITQPTIKCIVDGGITPPLQTSRKCGNILEKRQKPTSLSQSDVGLFIVLFFGVFCPVAITFIVFKIIAVYNFFKERKSSHSKSQEITKGISDEAEAIQLLINKEYYYEAIERTEPLLRKKENMTSQLYALAGLAYMKLEKSSNRTSGKDFFIDTQYFREIPELFEKSLALDENNKIANLFLCEYYIVNKCSHKKAIKALENAIKIFPDDLTLHNYLGLYYQKEDRLEDAIREFLIVADVLRDEKTYENLALVFFMNNQFDSAKHFIKLVLQKNPNNENVKMLLERINNPPEPIGKIITDFIKGTPFVPLYLILSVLLLIAVGVDCSKSYYMLLRLITSGICVYSAVKCKTEWIRWTFGGLAVLYNPILPIHLGDKDVWSLINLATIVYIWFSVFVKPKE